jgi:hypothetical protein
MMVPSSAFWTWYTENAIKSCKATFLRRTGIRFRDEALQELATDWAEKNGIELEEG